MTNETFINDANARAFTSFCMYMVIIAECEGGFWCGHKSGSSATKAKEEKEAKGSKSMLYSVDCAQDFEYEWNGKWEGSWLSIHEYAQVLITPFI